MHSPCIQGYLGLLQETSKIYSSFFHFHLQGYAPPKYYQCEMSDNASRCDLEANQMVELVNQY